MFPIPIEIVPVGDLIQVYKPDIYLNPRTSGMYFIRTAYG